MMGELKTKMEEQLELFEDGMLQKEPTIKEENKEGRIMEENMKEGGITEKNKEGGIMQENKIKERQEEAEEEEQGNKVFSKEFIRNVLEEAQMEEYKTKESQTEWITEVCGPADQKTTTTTTYTHQKDISTYASATYMESCYLACIDAINVMEEGQMEEKKEIESQHMFADPFVYFRGIRRECLDCQRDHLRLSTESALMDIERNLTEISEEQLWRQLFISEEQLLPQLFISEEQLWRQLFISEEQLLPQLFWDPFEEKMYIRSILFQGGQSRRELYFQGVQSRRKLFFRMGRNKRVQWETEKERKYLEISGRNDMTQHAAPQQSGKLIDVSKNHGGFDDTEKGGGKRAICADCHLEPRPGQVAGQTNDVATQTVPVCEPGEDIFRRNDMTQLAAPQQSGKLIDVTEDQCEFDDTEKDIQELEQLLRCKVCLDSDACIVFLPCRHMATCEYCEGFLHHCPVCRSFIEEAVKINEE